MSRGPRCSNGTPGNAGLGNPFGSDPDGRDPLGRKVEDAGHDGRADHRHEHRRHLFRHTGQGQQDGQRGETDQQSRRIRLVETRYERLRLVDEAVGVRREAEQLGQLPDEDGDRQAVHVADLDLLGEQVGDEAELADTESDLDRADHQGHHPGERDRGRRIAGHEQRRDGREDQRRHRGVRPEHEDARRTQARVPDEAGDRRIEAGDRRQPGELGVRHALRHQDRREDKPGDEIRPQPGSTVGS